MSRRTSRKPNQTPDDQADQAGIVGDPAIEPQEPQGAATTAPQRPQAPEPAPEADRPVDGAPRPTAREVRKLARKIPSDAEVASRRRRYAKHLPVYPLRASTVPEPLAHLPEFAECAEERAAVLAAEAQARQARKALHDRNESARRAHVDAQRTALLDGTGYPPPLVLEEWTGPEYDLHIFQELHQVIEAREAGLLAEHADRWTTALQADAHQLRERIAEAQDVVNALRAEAQPYEAALAALEGHRYVDDRIVHGSAPQRLSDAERLEQEHLRATWNHRGGDPRNRGRR